MAVSVSWIDVFGYRALTATLAATGVGSIRRALGQGRARAVHRRSEETPDAASIPEATAQELLDSDQDDLVVEAVVLEYLEPTDWIKEIQVINGLRRGRFTAASISEPVGTVIRMAPSR